MAGAFAGVSLGTGGGPSKGSMPKHIKKTLLGHFTTAEELKTDLSQHPGHSITFNFVAKNDEPLSVEYLDVIGSWAGSSGRVVGLELGSAFTTHEGWSDFINFLNRGDNECIWHSLKKLDLNGSSVCTVNRETTTWLPDEERWETRTTNCVRVQYPLDDIILEELMDFVPEGSVLRHLNLSKQEVGVRGCIALSKNFYKMRRLQFLGIRKREGDPDGIGPRGAVAIGEKLETIPNLNVLVLSGQPIGDEGLQGLARNFIDNSEITSLALDGCNIGVEGLRSLFENWHKLPKLGYLTLDGNRLGPEARDVLCHNNMRKLNQLNYFSIHNNDLGDDFVYAFTQKLSAEFQSSELNLSNCGIESAQTVRSVFECLSKCPSIVRVNLSSNPLNNEGREALMECLANLQAFPHLEGLKLENLRLNDREFRLIIDWITQDRFPQLRFLSLDKNNISNELSDILLSEVDVYNERRKTQNREILSPYY